jgi:hypothetical protein
MLLLHYGTQGHIRFTAGDHRISSMLRTVHLIASETQ